MAHAVITALKADLARVRLALADGAFGARLVELTAQERRLVADLKRWGML